MKLVLTSIVAAFSAVGASTIDASAVDTARKLAKFENVQKIVDATVAEHFRMTQLMDDGDDYVADDDYYGYSDVCSDAQSAIYAETPIAPAYIVNFLFSGFWADPSFDMKGYFDALDFDAQCANLNGTVYQPEIVLECPGAEAVSWTEYKFCRPTVCTDDFQYKFTQAGLLLALSEFIGCGLSLEDDSIPSMECVMANTQIYYNETEPLFLFSPTSVLSEEGLEVVESLDVCKAYGKGGFDIGVCHMTDAVEAYEIVTSACETMYDAKAEPWDLSLGVPFYYRTLRRYPLCVPNVCTTKDLVLYYGYLEEQYTNVVPGVPIDASFSPSVNNTCDETPKDKAFMKEIPEKVTIKSCKWLKRRPEVLKTKFCNKKSGRYGYPSAGEVCPSTCCTCEEKDDDVFMKKMSTTATGQVKLEKKTCAWLKNSPQGVIDFHCGKKAANFVGGLPPAAAACPQTCGCSE